MVQLIGWNSLTHVQVGERIGDRGLRQKVRTAPTTSRRRVSASIDGRSAVLKVTLWERLEDRAH